MKKTMFRMSLLVLGLAVLNGCIHKDYTQINCGPAVGAAPVNVDAAPAPERIIIAAERRDALRVSFRLNATNEAEGKLGELLCRDLAGALAAGDAQVVNAAPFDLLADMQVRMNVVDKDGEYSRVNSTVTSTVKSGSGVQVYATKAFKFVAPRRVLGSQAVVDQQHEGLSQDVVTWTKDAVTLVSSREIGVAVLKMQLPQFSVDPVKDAQCISAIGNELSKMPGVVSYQLLVHDQVARSCEYRVAYFHRTYPQGLYNAVSALVGKHVTYK